MERIRVEFPGPALFSHDLEVRISDVNYGGHLGHDALVSLLHDARARFFGAMGLRETDAGGAGVMLADLAVVYLAEAFFGQTLRVEIAAAGPERAACTLFYRVTDREAGGEIARARTGLVFFDYAARRVVRVPVPFLDGLTRLRAAAGGEAR